MILNLSSLPPRVDWTHAISRFPKSGFNLSKSGMIVALRLRCKNLMTPLGQHMGFGYVLNVHVNRSNSSHHVPSTQDIVDTTPYQGELDPRKIAKILLGGINRRIDRRGAPEAM